MTGVDEGILARATTARRLASLSASVIADATEGVGVVNGLRRFSGSGTLAGRVVTAEGRDGSMMAVFEALDQAQPGDVLCMTAPGPTAYLGDLLANDIMGRGLAGAVVDGLIRDVDIIAGLSASFFARGTTPAARRGGTPGQSMVPIELGGVPVAPGDWIVADGDGAVVVPAADLERVLAKAEEDARREARMMSRIAAGASVMDAVHAETDAGAMPPTGNALE